MDTKTLLKNLSESFYIGSVTETADLLKKEYPELSSLYGGSYCLDIKGEGDKTIALEAHIDEVGFIVTAVDERGFLRVSSVGGLDLRTLPSHRVIIHGKERVHGVFTSIPPHLTKGEPEFEDIKDLSVDSMLGEKAREVISVGDYITFERDFTALANGRVCGKSLDDRAGAAVLCLVAEKLKGQSAPVNVKLIFCNEEEIGTRGSKTAFFSEDCDEAVAIDVSFADAPGISPEQCGKLGGGAMLGYSPVLNREIYKKLIALAKENDIKHQSEIMGGRTGTDADSITISREGVPTGLVSIPLRNMHTDSELLDTADVEAAAELLYLYIMAGGALCD